MPLFTTDFAAVDAGFPMYDKGLYRIKITKMTPFVRESKPNKDTGDVKILVGAHFKLEMHGKFDDEGDIDTARSGKAVSRNTVYIHTEGALQYAKPFIMAACGYARNQQNEANEKLFQGGDWNISGDVGDAEEALEVGDSWNEPVDRFVDVQMHIEKTLDEDGNVTFEEQIFNNWYPVTG